MLDQEAMSKEKTETPSVEQYTNLKNELTKQILKKRELDAKLSDLEDLIYDKENDYFAESTYGNIVKGFDNFSKNSGGSSNKKRIQYTDEDHIFSLSSANYVKTLMKRQGISMGSGSSKEDLDEYEDSVDPGNSNSNEQTNNVENATTSNQGANIESTSYSGRKRKIRTFDD